MTYSTLSDRFKKTTDEFEKLSQFCSSVIASMWNMQDELRNALLTEWGFMELPPYQKFVSIYFIRNIIYLQSAYLLASGSLCEPSRDLQRTITETILRGYLFIVNEEEANRMDSLIKGTIRPKDRDLLRKRKYWPFKFLLGELYRRDTRKALKKFLERLSRSSHPSIMSAFTDLAYSSQSVEDCLNIVLMLSYHNIQMMAEGFLSFLKNSFRNVVRSTLKSIADFHGEIVLLEPDKRKYSDRIKLKKGNFVRILG
ncbi:MAG: hypothetical protein AYK18_09840 [Theionarchaea archaeon DG-70]|nr:MAG: hypothetical protein AYK18_09840 [Theionarchaea archaeon DG-70]